MKGLLTAQDVAAKIKYVSILLLQDQQLTIQVQLEAVARIRYLSQTLRLVTALVGIEVDQLAADLVMMLSC